MNLINETLNVLRQHQKAATDVRWVGSEDGNLAISWAEFVMVAVDSDYDNPSGRTQVAVDLVVVGEDWWLERHDCSGAEWWEFKALPIRSKTPQPFATVLGVAWDSLDKIQGQSQNENN